MGTRTDRTPADSDLGVLAGRLLFSFQHEMFTAFAEKGFGDLHPRHSAVLAHLDEVGVRATDLSKLSGVHKQVIGTVVDELERLGYVERRPDPADRRAKLICRTARGLDQMRVADAFVAGLERRHARRLGAEAYAQFRTTFTDVVEHQRRRVEQ